MKSILVLRKIKVENANAISGQTYGFPGISNFLGFSHALSRMLKVYELELGGCAVVCHQSHVNAHKPGGWGDYVFALTRNPLTKEATTPAFVEEGRMQMVVSLVIECDFTLYDFNPGTEGDKKLILEKFILENVYKLRIAGGTILNVGKVEFNELPEDYDELSEVTRTQLMKLLPGFALVHRPDILDEHLKRLNVEHQSTDLLDAWLDLYSRKYKAEPKKSDEHSTEDAKKVKWVQVPAQTGRGWFVPISVGFKAISELYPAGSVARSRDANTPTRFVESVYSLGEWISPHRVNSLKELIWKYEAHENWYLCRNNYRKRWI